MAGESQFVKVNGVWRAPNPGDTNHSYVKVNGQWRANNPGDTNAKYVKVNGQWRATETSNPPPSPGVYVLGATSIFLGTAGVGFAEFETTEYRGSISEIRARLSWTDFALTDPDVSISGRPTSNFYRTVSNINDEFNGRTIDHRIDTFDAGSLTEFNSGAAIGFNLEHTNGPSFLSTVINNCQLTLTIA